MAEDAIQLTPEQEKIILDAFNNAKSDSVPSITELVRLAFPNAQDIDGRSKEGRAVKALLVVKGLKARTSGEYQIQKIDLSDAHKEFIRNNRGVMTIVDMSRTLFANPQLTNLNVETRSVADYARSLSDNTDITMLNLAAVPKETYNPPKSIAGVLQRVDKYVYDHKIKKDEMTAAQKAGLHSLLSYMNTFRFVHQINLYENQVNRDLFESSFVRYCYDKHDLTEEEVDQYIVLSHEAVNSSNIQLRQEKLQTILDGNTSSDGDKARISMSLVEAISTLQNEYNQSASRFNSLLNSLKQKRSDRLAEQRSSNASILNLVQVWKEEKTRHNLLHLANMRKQVVRKAGEELASMAEVKARIFGHKLDELVDG
jgi:hypothetical protein